MRAAALIFGVLPLVAVAGEIARRSVVGSLPGKSESPDSVALNETVAVSERSMISRFETSEKDPATVRSTAPNSLAGTNIQIANPKLEGVLSLEIEPTLDLPLTGGFGVGEASVPNGGPLESRYFVASPSGTETFRTHEPEK